MVLVLAGRVLAGEVVLENGVRLQGVLAEEQLRVWSRGEELVINREDLRSFSSAPLDEMAGAQVAPPRAARLAPGARRFEVVATATALSRDAVAVAASVGRLIKGELVIYLDSIDRRLRILNALVFDGGYWIKVQTATGAEGWVPASTLRELP